MFRGISMHLNVHQRIFRRSSFCNSLLGLGKFRSTKFPKTEHHSYLAYYFKRSFVNQKQTIPVVSSKVCPHVYLETTNQAKLLMFCSFLTTVLKHRALHVRHNQLPLSREEEEARVINCETTFRNRFEDLRRRFDLV